jgi:hypothetical protein
VPASTSAGSGGDGGRLGGLVVVLGEDGRRTGRLLGQQLELVAAFGPLAMTALASPTTCGVER